MSVEKKDKKLFNTISKQYAKKDIAKSSMTARRHQVLFAMNPLLNAGEKIDTIIDIGCGVGASAIYLKNYFNKYIGIDYSKKLINIARDKNTNKNVSFINANIKDLNQDTITNNSADVIISIGALHHMTEVDRAMNSLKKFARSGTFFVALEPQNTNPLIQLMRKMRKKLDSSYSEQQVSFSPHDLKRLLTSNGLKLIDMRYQGYFVPPFAQVVLRPQIIFVPLCYIAIFLDNIIEKYLPNFIKKFSWNVVVIGKFP